MAALQAVIGTPGTGTPATASPGSAGSAVGSGNCVIGAVFYGYTSSADQISSVSDDKGNTYPLIDHIADAVNSQHRMTTFALFNITNAPSTLTANFTLGVTYSQVVWIEYPGAAGMAVAAHGGQSQNAPGTGTNAVTSGGVSAPAGTQVVGFGGDFSAVSNINIAAGTSFAQQAHDTSAAAWDAIIEDRISPGGTVAATFTDATNGGTDIYYAAIVALTPTPFPIYLPEPFAYQKLKRGRPAAAILAGSYTPPFPVPPAPRYGWELATPPLVTRSRARPGAQVATGLSLPPSKPTDLLDPRYGYELTSPPILKRPRGNIDLPVALVRQDTDAPTRYGYEPVAQAITRARPRPDMPAPLNRQDTDLPPPAVITWSPDHPSFSPRRPVRALVGADYPLTDVGAPIYGYELTTPPLARVRQKPDLPVPLGRQDTDLPSQYGYELTSPALLTRKRSGTPGGMSTDQNISPSEPVPPWTPWGWPVWANLRARPKPDLPVPLSRQGTDLPPAYGYELTAPPLLTRRRTGTPGAMSTDQAAFPPQPVAPWVSWGWPTWADLPIRRKRDLPVAPPSRQNTDPPWLAYGYDAPASPLRRPHPWLGPDGVVIYPVIAAPPPVIVWSPDPILFSGRHLRAPITEGVNPVYPQLAPPPAVIVWCPDPMLFSARRIARLPAGADGINPVYPPLGVVWYPDLLSVVGRRSSRLTTDNINPVYPQLTLPPSAIVWCPDPSLFIGRHLQRFGATLGATLGSEPVHVVPGALAAYGYELTSTPLLTRFRGGGAALYRSVFWPAIHGFVPPPPVPIYALLEMTAPQFILDLATILPPGVTLAKIVSATPLSGLFAAYPVLQSFANIAVISFGRAISPTTGLLQAISGEVQAMRIPAIIRFECIDSAGEPFIVDAIYRGAAKFVYFPTPIKGS